MMHVSLSTCSQVKERPLNPTRGQHSHTFLIVRRLKLHRPVEQSQIKKEFILKHPIILARNLIKISKFLNVRLHLFFFNKKLSICSKNAPISAFINVFIIIYLDLWLSYWFLCYFLFSCCFPICKIISVENYSACKISFTNKQTKKVRN